MRADCMRIDIVLDLFEGCHRFQKGFRRLLSEAKADLRRGNGFPGAAGVERQDRPPRCHGFHRQDAEIFGTRKQQLYKRMLSPAFLSEYAKPLKVFRSAIRMRLPSKKHCCIELLLNSSGPQWPPE